MKSLKTQYLIDLQNINNLLYYLIFINTLNSASNFMCNLLLKQ